MTGIIGENAKFVYKALLQFLKNRPANIVSAANIEYNLSGLTHIVRMREIRDEILLPARFDPGLIFDRIVDIYNDDEGIRRFINFREAIQLEQEKNFQNLSYVINLKPA